MFTEYMSWPEACAATGLDEKSLTALLWQHTRDFEPGTYAPKEPHYQHPRRRHFTVYKNYQILYGDVVKSLSECPLCIGEGQ